MSDRHVFSILILNMKIFGKLENKTITTKCVYNLVVSQNSHFIIRLKNVKNSVMLGLAELVTRNIYLK